MSTQDVAITTANSVREVALTEHQIILDYCVPRYKNAAKPSDVAEVDKTCLPAEKAYAATKLLWESLVATLQMFKAGKASEPDVVAAADKLSAALADLKIIAGGLK